MECTQCGSPAKQLIFGMLAGPLTPEEEQLYIVGGCILDDWKGPVFQCTHCEHQWSDPAALDGSSS